MAKLPLPPATLPPLRAGDTLDLARGQLLWRIYRAGGDHPVRWDTLRTWGPTATGRFDHHPPPAHDDSVRAIAYASLDIAAAVAEAFQATRTIDRYQGEPFLVGFELLHAVTVLDLGGLWPTRAGASQAIASGRRDTSRAWSRAIYEAYPRIGGIAYPSAMAGGSTNVALYERARGSLPTGPRFHAPLTHPGLDLPIRRIAGALGYGVRSQARPGVRSTPHLARPS